MCVSCIGIQPFWISSLIFLLIAAQAIQTLSNTHIYQHRTILSSLCSSVFVHHRPYASHRIAVLVFCLSYFILYLHFTASCFTRRKKKELKNCQFPNFSRDRLIHQLHLWICLFYSIPFILSFWCFWNLFLSAFGPFLNFYSFDLKLAQKLKLPYDL